MEVELVVVGAGVYGITAAETYHRLHPTARLLLLEGSPSVGGPWASHRAFPGLVTNNLLGMYENPDFPMDEERFQLKKGEHIPAEKLTKYLEALIEEKGLSDFVKLNTKVEVVEQVDEGWRLHCSTASENEDSKFAIKTAKLILAAGVLNQSNMPRYPTSPEFAPKVIHSKDFPAHFNEIVKPDSNTLVIGCGKSACDIAYACATQPKSTATMLMRPSGSGPPWMSPAFVTPFNLQLEKLVLTRILGFMSPCPWAASTGFEGWARGLLHGTWLGKKIVEVFWGIITADVVGLTKMMEHSKTKEWRPWRDVFECGNDLGILNYPTNFFDLVKEGKIRLIMDEVETFSGVNDVKLKDGKTINADAIVCATGWQAGRSIQFKPDGLDHRLGLPSIGEQHADDAGIARKAEAELYSRFPHLKERDTGRVHHPDPAQRNQPTLDSQANQKPYRLYRFLVPPSDLKRRSIGFAGALMSLGNSQCAYVQSLWLAAYLDGTLQLPPVSQEQLTYETYVDTQYCTIRHTMGYGKRFPDLVWDSIPYYDVLMRDLGFNEKRKGAKLGMKNWLAEWFKNYGPEDYRGLVAEWQTRLEIERKAAKKTL